MVAEGCAITGARASQRLLRGAGSPTATGTAGLCRALPALRRVAAEGLSCYVAVVAAGAAVASLHADEQGQGCHRESLAHRHRERGPAACGQQRVSPSPWLARGPCQHPAPRDVRTRVGNSSATSTRAGAAHCWQPRAPSPARFVTMHFKATEGVQDEPLLVTATQQSARSPAGMSVTGPGTPTQSCGQDTRPPRDVPGGPRAAAGAGQSSQKPPGSYGWFISLVKTRLQRDVSYT